MTDHVDGATRDEVAGPWLSPSEALTRFVPGQQATSRDERDLAPIRFGFRVSNIGLLVPTGMLSELIEDAEVYSLPTTAPWFRGLINLRGELVPVFDLKRFFMMETAEGEAPNLLVLNSGQGAVCVLIDGLPRAVDIGRRLEQAPPLPELLREHSRAVYLQEEGIWVDFDFDGLFGAMGSRVAI